MNTLFLQSEVADPYAHYATMRRDHPVYYDRANNLWAVYTWEHCTKMLQHSAAVIPAVTHTNGLLSDTVMNVFRYLPRLSNAPTHLHRRAVSTTLMASLRPVTIAKLVQQLTDDATGNFSFDWVRTIATRLPAAALLLAAGIPWAVTSVVLDHLEDLARIMAPVTAAAAATKINQAYTRVLPLLKEYAATKDLSPEESNFRIANFTGLLIQAYDAGRGLLSNAMLQWLEQPATRPAPEHFTAFIREVLRFDPPVQHTRRLLAGDIAVDDVTIPKGAQVLVVLASANRDERIFADAATFNIHRPGHPGHLTFGTGAHQCVAEHFIVPCVADTLRYFCAQHQHIELMTTAMHYEPRLNVRLPQKMCLTVC